LPSLISLLTERSFQTGAVQKIGSERGYLSRSTVLVGWVERLPGERGASAPCAEPSGQGAHAPARPLGTDFSSPRSFHAAGDQRAPRRHHQIPRHREGARKCPGGRASVRAAWGKSLGRSLALPTAAAARASLGRASLRAARPGPRPPEFRAPSPWRGA
jgi:hypothetical protein